VLTACNNAVHDRQLNLYALGTEVSISMFGVSDSQANAAQQQLQSYFATVGHDWYPWRPGELARINAAIAAQRAVQVSPRLARVLQRAAEIETLSGNTFNAGLGRLTELWGLHDLGSAPQQVPDAAAIAELLAGISVAAMRWDDNEITAAPSSLMLDPGGIAKGAILEDSMRMLEQLGIGNAIVNIGGDLSVSGDVHGRPARVGIRSPEASAAIAAIDVVAGETVVTSGDYERYIEIQGHRYTHILDPRSGYPVEHTASVTVIHTDAMLADAAATALMVGGSAEFDALTQSLNLDYALLIDSSGDLRLTPAMAKRLDWLQ